MKLISSGRKYVFFVLLVSLLLFSCGSKSDESVKASSTDSSKSGSNIEESSLSADQADVSSIDAIVNAIYDTVSFRDGEEPNWNRFRSLFSSNAQLIRIAQDGVKIMNIENFVLSFTERIKSGEMRSFYEEEISRKTHSFGSIAQVFSSYKKRINTEEPESAVRGINSFQLYFDGQRWWISSLLWEDEWGDKLIPKEYRSTLSII